MLRIFEPDLATFRETMHQEKCSDSRLQFRLFSYLCRRSCILKLNLRLVIQKTKIDEI